MANFGFSRLSVVNPYDVAFREARSAVGAAPLLQKAEEFASLADAVADCRLVVGTTSVGHRELQHPIRRLEYGARLMLRVVPAAPVALVFGSEKFGLSNDDLSHCHWLMRIPTVGQDLSMNLGQAVALCLYEMARDPKAAAARPVKIASASAGETEQITLRLLEALAQERVREPRHRHLYRREGPAPGAPPGNFGERCPGDPGNAAPDSVEAPGTQTVGQTRNAPNIAAVVTTVAYSPARFARLIACTSAAVRQVPAQSLRPNVKHASSTTKVAKPRLPAIRTVASTELFVITPATISVSTPAARNRDSRSVPIKALLVRLATTGSPACGIASGLNSCPACPGR